MGGDFGPQVGGFFPDWAGDGGAFHFTFWVDDDAGVVLKVYVVSFSPPEGLSLANDDCLVNYLEFFFFTGFTFLPELRLALFD